MGADKVSEIIQFELDETENLVYAVLNLEHTECEFSEQWLEDQLDKQGYAGIQIFQPALNELAELFKHQQSGKVTLGKKVDAKAEIIVSKNLISATLRITAAYGGKRIGIPEVMKALNDQEIDLDLVNKKRVIGLVRKSRIIKAGEVVDVVVAKGWAAIDGKDTEFECLIDGVTDRRPHRRLDGTLDYYDLGAIVTIEEASSLMRKHPPTEAKNGRSVTGSELVAKAGKKLNFKKCKGSSVSPTDPDLLISSIKGQPVFSERGISIESVYAVKNVDLRTGHVDYDGSLVVKGDVVSGMKIKVTGDVQVLGMVENGCIQAGGNVDIKLGAVGHAQHEDEEQCMVINCKGNLTAAYLENATIQVEGDVLIKSRVSNCDLQAGCQVIVGNHQQQKSGIVGGQVSAGSIIRAEVIGSSGGALTQVAISDKENVLEQLTAVKQVIAGHDDTLIKKLGVMVGLSKQHTDQAKVSFNVLKMETESLKREIADLMMQKHKLELLSDSMRQGKVIAQREVYPGVSIKIMGRTKVIKSTFKQGSFFFRNGFIAHNSSLE